MKTFEEIGIRLTGKGKQQKVICPRCSHLRRKKNDPCLSVNVSEGVYNCFHCHWSGNIKERTYEKPMRVITEEKKIYTKSMLKYFQDRGISEDTLKVVGVTEGIEWMPGPNKELNTIQFNYFRDEELINVKYRSEDKHFKLYKDAELIFYNLDGIKDELECIITEGEIDCLSLVEIGITNVVSVPNGANKNLQYVENCKSYFEEKDKIYLATDSDVPGLKLRDEFVRIFGANKCFLMTYPEGCKDANDVLIKHGADKLREVYYTAKMLPVNDVIYVDNILERLIFEFNNGTERGTTTYFPCLDTHFNWLPGDVTLFHGIPNHGKSKIVKQLWLLKSVKEGTKWAIFSPEEYPPTYFYSDLAHTLIGKNVSSKYNNQCSKDEYIEALNFIKKHFFFIFPKDNRATQKFINDKFKELIMKEGIHGGIIDPFNQLDNNFGATGRDDYYLSDFLYNEKSFALKHNFIKLIVAHPKMLKRNAKGKYDCPDAYDLSHGAMWYNKSDNILALHRPYFKYDCLSTESELHIQKIKKQSLVGIPGMVKLNFNMTSNRYLEQNGYSPFEDELDKKKSSE